MKAKDRKKGRLKESKRKQKGLKNLKKKNVKK